MRWKGLIPLVLILGVLIMISVLFMDRWIESGLEKAGEAAVGAKVEIDGFHLNLLKLSVKWDRLQAADPRHTMQNLVETGRAAFSMSFPALLRKRAVIHEMILTDVRSKTPRKNDGSLPKKKPKPPSGKPDFLDKMKSKLKSEINAMPVVRFDLNKLKRSFNTDSLVAITGIRFPGRLDSVRTDAACTAADWDVFFKTFHPEDDLARIRDGLKDAEPKQIKTIPELLSLVNRVQTSYKTVKAVSDTVSLRNQKFKQDYGRLLSYTGQVSEWVQDDYKRILAKAQLPDLSIHEVGKMVFGPQLVGQADLWIGRYQTLQKYLPKKSSKSAKPEKQKRTRMQGQDIIFPDRYGWPTFFIGKLYLSGQTGPTDTLPGFRLSGEITDISSQPWITGRPMVVTLSGNKADGRSVNILSVLDRRTENASDSFAVRFGNVSLNHVAVEKGPYLPSQIQEGKADIDLSVRIREEDFAMQLSAAASELAFDFDSTAAGNTFVRILRDVIQNLNVVTVQSRIRGRGDRLDFGLDSNLDDQVAGELRRISSKALADAQNKIRARLGQIENEKRAELAKILDVKKKEFEEKLSSYIKLSDEQRALVQDKIKLVQDEIDRRKNKEQDQLNKKASELLDGILKKK